MIHDQNNVLYLGSKTLLVSPKKVIIQTFVALQETQCYADEQNDGHSGFSVSSIHSSLSLS
jgi:hypothetical protein